jgi:signal peptidase I
LWKKVWFLFWEDDSFKGWIFSIIFIFLFVKFIFFPFLSFITGTNIPLAIVESCSMYHKGNIFSDFDGWWERHSEKYDKFNITKEQFSEFKMKNGFNKGDIIFIIGTKPESIKVGDIIIFNAGQRNPIIHRVVSIKREGNSLFFSTIGDNNEIQAPFEVSISQEKIVGKAVFKVAPYLGWIKLVFYESKKPIQERGLCKENNF